MIIVKVMEHIAQLYPAHFPMLLQPLLPTVLRNLIEEEVRREGGREREEGRREEGGRYREIWERNERKLQQMFLPLPTCRTILL